MATVLDTLKKGTEYLAKHHVEDARLNMQHLLAHVLKCDRMQVYLDFDRELDENQLAGLRDLTKRRAQGEPLQHLMGNTEFCGFLFKVDQRALIPRPETEELTTLCAKLSLPESPRILDLGCGSGVIGITLALLLEEKRPAVTLVDKSPEALSLARENKKELAPQADLHFVESDLFCALDSSDLGFDLVASNLPYVPKHEQIDLCREVLRDPPMALYGGEKGTEMIERFFSEVSSYLKAGGHVAIEFGIGQEEAVGSFAEQAQLESIRVVRDLSGTNRFLFAAKT